MSVPARKITTPAPASTRVAPSARRPAARPRPSTPPHASLGARRGVHSRFWVLAALVVAGLVIGVVALHALTVQTQYSIRSQERRAADLATQNGSLIDNVARLSSPARVEVWARGRGMVTPDDVVIVRVAGASDASGHAAGGARG